MKFQQREMESSKQRQRAMEDLEKGVSKFFLFSIINHSVLIMINISYLQQYAKKRACHNEKRPQIYVAILLKVIQSCFNGFCRNETTSQVD